jgi:hypothetical protein
LRRREAAENDESSSFPRGFTTHALAGVTALRETSPMTQEFINDLACMHPSYSRKTLAQASTIRQVYQSPAYGWEFACDLADARLMFPVVCRGRNSWLFLAYMSRLAPAACRHHDVEAAHQISRQPGLSAKLKALIIAGLGKPVEDHLTLVATKSGISRQTVEAFETLWFNVLDRPRDGAYLSHIVYPETRFVELAEDYIVTTPISDLLLRAAYNHQNIDLVLELAGMKESDSRKKLADLHQLEVEYLRNIMGNGLLIAKAGLLNQPGAGLQRATQLLGMRPQTASEQSHAEALRTCKLVAEQLAATIATTPKTTEEERELLRATARPGRSYMHDDEGNILPFDHADLAPDVVRVVESSPDHIEEFPESRHAIWKNKDTDMPVVIVALMSQPGFEDHYLTEGQTGIPASQVFFEN